MNMRRLLCIVLPAFLVFFPLKVSAVGDFIAFPGIMKRHEIRCGYVLYPPFVDRDVNSGKMTGPMIRLWEEIGKRLELKITWTEETGWGTMIEGLRAGRYDAVCSTVWANAQRSRFVNFSIPLGYERISLYARADDRRFDNKIDILNDHAIRFATLDGEMGTMLVRRRFPKAREIAAPQNASMAEVLQNVVTKKADLALVDPLIADQYMKNNPHALRIVPGGEIMQSFPVTVLIPQMDIALKTMIDQALDELRRDGTIQQIMTEHGLPDQWRQN
jgi:ABC-type amino acid transport substrate-binding protein